MIKPNSHNYLNFNPSGYQKLCNSVTQACNAVSTQNIAAITTGHGIKISPSAHCFLEKLSPFQRMQVSRKIAHLSATPRPGDASQQRRSKDIYCVTEISTAISISYKVHAGTVYVLEIVPNPMLKGAGKQVPALHFIERQGPIWAVQNKVKTIKTRHAAVNGQSNELDKASNLMGIHLSTMFKQDKIEAYTLFHNPTDGGFWDTYESSRDKKQLSTAVAKQFAKVLANVQKQGQPVKWLAHSQGGLIFTESTRYLQVQGHKDLSMNSVQFDAGANNEVKTRQILDRVGISIHGFNNHPFDPVPNLIGGNAQDWVSVLGSALGLLFVFGDDPNKSPHTLPYTGKSAVVNKVYDIKDKSALMVQAIINSLPR